MWVVPKKVRPGETETVGSSYSGLSLSKILPSYQEVLQGGNWKVFEVLLRFLDGPGGDSLGGGNPARATTKSQS